MLFLRLLGLSLLLAVSVGCFGDSDAGSGHGDGVELDNVAGSDGADTSSGGGSDDGSGQTGSSSGDGSGTDADGSGTDADGSGTDADGSGTDADGSGTDADGSGGGDGDGSGGGGGDGSGTDVKDAGTADAGGKGDGDGADKVCSERNGCTSCVYETAPETEADCHCPLCPSYVMTVDQCEYNTAAFNKVCGPWLARVLCPIPACIAPPPLHCQEGECVVTDEGPPRQ